MDQHAMQYIVVGLILVVTGVFVSVKFYKKYLQKKQQDSCGCSSSSCGSCPVKKLEKVS